jgi:hypothetical protein
MPSAVFNASARPIKPMTLTRAASRDDCLDLARRMAQVIDQPANQHLSRAQLIDLSVGVELVTHAPGRVSSRIPETPSQAITWQTVKAKYVASGLCHACAAQAAWGHQLGFGHPGLRPPCDQCRPRVAALPSRVNSKASAWRRFTAATRRHPQAETVDIDVAGGLL